MFRSEMLAVRAPRRYNPPMGTAPSAPIEIKLFGGLEIRRDGEIVALPQSKKTRALLAYLILKGTPQRRDALCELLWEIPDDPRAALRWSLSKLRPLVNDEATERLTADRERVAFEPHGAVIDVVARRGSLRRGPRTVFPRAIERALPTPAAARCSPGSICRASPLTNPGASASRKKRAACICASSTN